MKKILTIITAAFLLYGCGSAKEHKKSDDFKIKKVHKFIKQVSLQLDKQSFTESSGIGRFTSDNDDKKLSADKQGEEIIITWKYKSKTPLNDVKLTFTYKTAKEAKLKTIEKIYPSVTKGSYKFNMPNTGALFGKQGTVALWKITLEHEGELMAVKKSALWKDIQPWKEKAFTKQPN